jgi:plastocyanin
MTAAPLDGFAACSGPCAAPEGRAVSTRTGTLRRPAAVLTAVALAAAALTACGDGSALGLEQPPASLDPSSPRLAAEGIAFDQPAIQVRAGTPFVIVFENRDTASHNLSIYADEGLRDRRFEGVLFGGPATRWYPVPALAAGTYVFVCELHPAMRGRLVAD